MMTFVQMKLRVSTELHTKLKEACAGSPYTPMNQEIVRRLEGSFADERLYTETLRENHELRHENRELRQIVRRIAEKATSA
jgi:hypothetical protein